MRHFLYLALLLSLFSEVAAQKSISATRITTSPVTIDGQLTEEIWALSEIATDFTTQDPVPGLTPDAKTQVKVLYDDEALYVGAFMQEVSKDSIMTQLTERDNIGNTDYFSIVLDTYGNGTDGVTFLVAATGVQYDALKSNQGWDDSDWDAVWESATHLTDEGWYCEMKIPYAALRFSSAEEQIWTINFLRTQRRNNMTAAWSFVDPKKDGLFTQSGQLTDIKDIEPPVRLSLTPYLSTYTTSFRDANASPSVSRGYTYNAGMDIKYGINDAFTLDMILVPDFGQVEADDLVVNLSPFEVRLSEKRPFFTEGLELFSKADLFYTRRIGGTAFGYADAYNQLSENESVTENPQIPQLYNATKISGRNKNGLAIGVFNAVEAATNATIQNLEENTTRELNTQPLTNYNIIVLDQNLPNNSSISLINTNVWRKGAEYYDANVTGTEFSLKDKNQRFEFSGEGAFSLQTDDNSDNNTGHKMELDLDKIAGNWRYGLAYDEVSKNYDQNDLGFQRESNVRSWDVFGAYNFFEPKGPFNQGEVWTSYGQNFLIDPNVRTNSWVNLGFWTQTNKFWSINMWGFYSTQRRDYFEPRTPDFSRYVVQPQTVNGGFSVSTNGNKDLSFFWNGNLYNVAEEGRWGYFLGMGPRYNFSDRLSMSLTWRYGVQNDDTGWVETLANDDIILGQRENINVTNVFNVNYTLNNRMSFNLRTRHDWTKIVYNSFHLLGPEGELLDTEYWDDEADFTFDFFSVDWGFNWRFARGSDLFLVWKSNIAGGVFDPAVDFRSVSYFNGLSTFRDHPQQNSLSLRITYYLDQTNFRKWAGKS